MKAVHKKKLSLHSQNSYRNKPLLSLLSLEEIWVFLIDNSTHFHEKQVLFKVMLLYDQITTYYVVDNTDSIGASVKWIKRVAFEAM